MLHNQLKQVQVDGEASTGRDHGLQHQNFDFAGERDGREYCKSEIDCGVVWWLQCDREFFAETEAFCVILVGREVGKSGDELCSLFRGSECGYGHGVGWDRMDSGGFCVISQVISAEGFYSDGV